MNRFEKIAKNLTAMVREYNWADGDMSAPDTPWGEAQTANIHDSGIVWYSTAGHGGLFIPMSKARTLLSSAAMSEGIRWKSGYWFEEDVAWMVVAYEQNDLVNELFRGMGKGTIQQDDIDVHIQRGLPDYFRNRMKMG
jgi:hypothetical protein